MPRNDDFKDPGRGGASPLSAAQASSAVSSESTGGEGYYAGKAERKTPQRSQVSDSSGSVRVSPSQFRQVIAELRASTPERKITEHTGVSEPYVRAIRSLYMSMPERHMSVMGLLFDQFFAGVRAMQADIAEGIYEEVNERVA